MTFADRLIQEAEPIWAKYYEHPFIQNLIDGSLDRRKFLRYLIQDTLYLKDYAKVYAHAFTKAEDVEVMRHIYSDMALIMSDETMVHIRYLKDMGWSEAEAMAEPCAPANEAYLNTMLTAASEGTLAEGVVSVMACAFSYYFIAKYAKAEGDRRNSLADNYFSGWIESYAGDMYEKIYSSSYKLCNSVCTTADEVEAQRLIDIFLDCSECELRFWDMAFEETDIRIA